jgi:hypothetical protein
MIDRKLITDIWYLLRDYGDLTNAPTQEGRWSEYVDKSNEIRRRYPEARRLFIDLDIMLERRSKAADQGELKMAQ